MKSKLKAIQILEIMLDNPLNNKRIFDQSDDTVYNGEEWLHIDEALAELKEFVKDSLMNKHETSRSQTPRRSKPSFGKNQPRFASYGKRDVSND